MQHHLSAIRPKQLRWDLVKYLKPTKGIDLEGRICNKNTNFIELSLDGDQRHERVLRQGSIMLFLSFLI